MVPQKEWRENEVQLSGNKAKGRASAGTPPGLPCARGGCRWLTAVVHGRHPSRGHWEGEGKGRAGQGTVVLSLYSSSANRRQ